MSDFDDAISSVSSAPAMIDVEFKQRKYPVAEAGVYEATVCDVKLYDSTYHEGEKVMKLLLELPTTYKDDDGKDRHHRIFSKPISFMFGPKSSLSSLCKDLTGRPPLFMESKEVRNGDTYLHRKFNPNQFKEMTCSVVVKHVQSGEKTYANIVAFMANDTQKKANCDLIPKIEADKEVVAATNARQKPTIKAEKTEKELTKDDLATAEATYKQDPFGDIKKLIASAGTERDITNMLSLLVEDSSLLSEKEKEKLKDLAADRINAVTSL